MDQLIEFTNNNLLVVAASIVLFLKAKSTKRLNLCGKELAFMILVYLMV